MMDGILRQATWRRGGRKLGVSTYKVISYVESEYTVRKK